MLRHLKKPILRTLKSLGIQREWNDSSWRRERLAILCYHGIAIADECEWNPSLYMPPTLLEERLKFLRDGGYNVLPLGEAVRRLYQKDLPDRSVALTFDDGGYDFYQRAYPLLKKYELPATVYLSTYYCYKSLPIFPLSCHYLLWKARHTFRGDELQDWGCPDRANLHLKTGIEAAVSTIVNYANTLNPSERRSIPEQLARRLGVDWEEFYRRRLFQLMRPDEVTRVSADGIDIQLHTHRHRVPMDRELFIREIQDNRRCILEMTGIEAIHFCYPSGVYDHTFLPWLAEEHVISATTCEAGLASRKDHPLLLPRIADTTRMSAIEFESALAGISAALVRRRGGRRATSEA